MFVVGRPSSTELGGDGLDPGVRRPRVRDPHTDLAHQELGGEVVGRREHLADDVLERGRLELRDFDRVGRCDAVRRDPADDDTAGLEQLGELARREHGRVGSRHGTGPA